MANWHSYHKRYMENQANCEPTDTGTDQTTEDPSPCHFYAEHHKVCTQVNRQKLNETIDVVQRSNEDLIDSSILHRFSHNSLDTNKCTSTCIAY